MTPAEGPEATHVCRCGAVVICARKQDLDKAEEERDDAQREFEAARDHAFSLIDQREALKAENARLRAAIEPLEKLRAAVTKERDEANRDLAATIQENDRLHSALLENARLRAAIEPTLLNVNGVCGAWRGSVLNGSWPNEDQERGAAVLAAIAARAGTTQPTPPPSDTPACSPDPKT